ncbi:MAG: WYL domain-containing protein, partial [Lachnospiraceae bacterium]|nr:WYL domain-containing protein [Lachnospiraceae bacterium]
MPKSMNQKLKLLYILKILSEQTDEEHYMSAGALIEELAKYDIKAERKSIYDDMNQLMDFGYDIILVKSRVNGGYYLAGRDFELAELKLLVEVVQSSKFLTQKKSKELIGKIEKLASKWDAKQLQRQVYVANRIKTANESIYYIVDDIHRAIQNNE